MIVSGATVPAEQLQPAGLFDEIVPGDIVEGALAFASASSRETRAGTASHRKVKHDNPEAFLQFARNTVGAMSKNFPAPLKCIDAVAASVDKPFEEGLRIDASSSSSS